MKYSDFIIKEQQTLDYYQLLADKGKLEYRVKELENEVEKLKRENFGNTQTIEHLKEKLYKRNESFKGNVWDKNSYKGYRNR